MAGTEHERTPAVEWSAGSQTDFRDHAGPGLKEQALDQRANTVSPRGDEVANFPMSEGNPVGGALGIRTDMAVRGTEVSSPMGYFVQGLRPPGFRWRQIASTFHTSPTAPLDSDSAAMRLHTVMSALLLACGLFGPLRSGEVRAQAGTAVEAAAGTALGVDGGSGAVSIGVSVGLSRRLRARAGATFTAGRVLASLESTLAFDGRPRVFVPYLLVGAGVVFGGPESAVAGVWGGGLRGRIDARTALLIEARGFVVDEARAPGGSLTIGLRRIVSF